MRYQILNNFEFMYGNEWYKYENNRILKKNGFDYFDFFIPVHVNIDLNKFDKPDAKYSSSYCSCLYVWSR